jgi:hypothetical protein
MLWNIVKIYLILGVVVWGAHLASDVYNRTMQSQPTCADGDAPTVTQVPGMDASGLLQIIMWAPSLIQTLRHGIPATEFVRPAECVPKGSIAFRSTRCECQVPVIIQKKLQSFRTLPYWAAPDVTCEAAKPTACGK